VSSKNSYIANRGFDGGERRRCRRRCCRRRAAAATSSFPTLNDRAIHRTAQATNVRRYQVKWFIAGALHAIFLEMRFNFNILEPLLEKGNQRARRHFGIGKDCSSNERLVRESKGAVRKTRFLQVTIH
jgi:hypothetical protein